MVQAPIILPLSQRAIIASNSKGDLKVAENVPIIELDPDAVLIKTSALALNPVDTKMLAGFASAGAILGFDFSGTIVGIGSEVTRPLSVGDRVCGSADSMNSNRPYGGAFAEYTSCPASLVLKLPADLAFADAAGLGTAIASAGLALFYSLKIPASLDVPAETPFWVLVNGGSSATGTMMTQLLKLCNVRPIVTCSPKHFDLVVSYGAEKAFDYTSPTVAQDIRDYTGNSLAFAVHCITETPTMKLCYAAMGRLGGRYSALDPYPEAQHTRKVVKPDWILATSVTGRGNSWPAPYGREGDPEVKSWAEKFFNMAQKAVKLGSIRSHPMKVCEGGFEGLLEGIEMIRRREVSGYKLVYMIT